MNQEAKERIAQIFGEQATRLELHRAIPMLEDEIEATKGLIFGFTVFGGFFLIPALVALFAPPGLGTTLIMGGCFMVVGLFVHGIYREYRILKELERMLEGARARVQKMYEEMQR
jgi:hypothetical protein